LFSSEHHAIKICGEVELTFYKLLNSVAVGNESDKL